MEDREAPEEMEELLASLLREASAALVERLVLPAFCISADLSEEMTELFRPIHTLLQMLSESLELVEREELEAMEQTEALELLALAETEVLAAQRPLEALEVLRTEEDLSAVMKRQE